MLAQLWGKLTSDTSPSERREAQESPQRPMERGRAASQPRWHLIDTGHCVDQVPLENQIEEDQAQLESAFEEDFSELGQAFVHCIYARFLKFSRPSPGFRENIYSLMNSIAGVTTANGMESLIALWKRRTGTLEEQAGRLPNFPHSGAYREAR